MEAIEDAAARAVPDGVGGADEALSRRAAGLVRDEALMRREDPFRAGSFEDLGGAVEAGPHVFDIPLSEPIADARRAVATRTHYSLAAIAQQESDAGHPGKERHQFRVLRRAGRSEGTRLNSSHVRISYAVFCL